jgi:hypothetical protein
VVRIMSLRRLLCNVLAVLKMHHQDCDHCNALQECWGIDMRKRLEDLTRHEQAPKDKGTGAAQSGVEITP